MMKLLLTFVVSLFICLLTTFETSNGAVLETLAEEGVDGSAITLHYIDPGFYIFGAGGYFTSFLTTGEGVIVFDAPLVFVGSIIPIIESLTDEPIKFVIYTHHHLDHIGGAYEYAAYSDDITYICHKLAGVKIAETTDYTPACDITVNKDDMTDDTDWIASTLRRSRSRSRQLLGTSVHTRRRRTDYTDSGVNGISNLMKRNIEENGILEVGYQTLNLDYYGKIHSAGLLWIFSEQHEYLCVVDWVFPGWMPFRYFALSEDITQYRDAHDIALDRYNFNYYVGGHVDRIGSRHDIEVNQDYVLDTYDAVNTALLDVDPVEATAGAVDPYDATNKYLDALNARCAELLTTVYGDSEWYQTWQGTSYYMEDNCWWVSSDIRVNW